MESRTILLDEQGDSRPGNAFRRIDTDAALLRHAMSSENLHVVGPRLCRWSRAYFHARPESVEVAISLTVRLREVFPALEPDEARALGASLEEQGFSYGTGATPLDSQTVLARTHPGFPWKAAPGTQHAATFLLWVIGGHDDATWRKLVEPLASSWESATPTPVGYSYSARTPDDARGRLLDWLGLGRPGAPYSQFPLAIPDAEISFLRQNLRELSTQTAGRAHENLGSGAPLSVVILAAESDFRYLDQNPDRITGEVVTSLEAALPVDRIQKLRAMVPQRVPNLPPDDIAAIIQWYKDEYLPYRKQQWASSVGRRKPDGELSAVVDDVVPKLLGHYADGLFGGAAEKHMNHVRMEQMVRSTGQGGTRALFVALLDGLTVPDGDLVRQAIERTNGRLQTLTSDITIATVPTITQFAKPSLLAGKPPVRAAQMMEVSKYMRLTEVRNALRDIGPGDTVIWSVLQPDIAYHGATDVPTAISTARSELEGLGRQIAELANEADSSVELEILVCTDHGRLMGVAQRRVAPPVGWSAHGRAAWGAYIGEMPACGYFRDGDLAYLDAERFGLQQDAAFVWGEDAYLTVDGRSGEEVSPHGGLYPEEVLVPWIVLGRDRGPADVKTSVVGEGQAQHSGALTIRLVNEGDSPATANELQLHIPGRETVHVPLSAHLVPAQMQEVQWTLNEWPTSEQASHTEGQVLVSLPNGRRHKLACDVRISSADMYQRDNLLDELL